MFDYFSDLVAVVKKYPGKHLDRLIQTGSPMERAATGVAHPQFIPVLVQDQDWWVRWTMAGLPWLSDDDEQVLAGDECVEVRIRLAAVASNETLEFLSHDARWQVRRAVAAFATPSLCEQLACDTEPVVRISVAGNSMCPEEVRGYLIDHDSDEVVMAFARRVQERLAGMTGEGH